MSWIARKSKHNPDFARGDTLAKGEEFLESVRVTAIRYEATSDTPDYPRRSDTYYTHGTLPPPHPEHANLERLLSFFCPASPLDKALIRALLCQPIWYIRGIPRPGWIIDAHEAQGCGKTTLAELVAYLYGGATVETSKQELEMRRDALTKRCLSYDGRKNRIMLLDNITGDFSSDELANWMTRQDITGMAPYGRGEECRPNNFTFILTANTATVSHDLADRCFHVFLTKPPRAETFADWKQNVMAYIDKNRLAIFSDIVDLISRHRPFDTLPQTRFAAFERAILQPCCGTDETYRDALEYLQGSSDESDSEAELARTISERFEFQIAEAINSSIPQPVFIRTELVNSWGRKALNDLGIDTKSPPIQIVRNLAKTGAIRQIDATVKRWPVTSRRGKRVSGLAWCFSETTDSAIVIGRDASENVFTERVES
jgi:hypothetical protein